MRSNVLFVLSVFAACAAQAVQWDFTGGIPPDVKPRSCAAFDGRGLVPTQITNRSAGAGVVVGSLEIPEAFRFSAEFVPRLGRGGGMSPGRRENVLFDNLYVPYARPGFNCGLYVAMESNGRRWTPKACLGFGDDVTVVRGPELLADGTRTVRVAFTYDAGRGVAWEVDGVIRRDEIVRSGPLARSKRPAAVGERGCADYRQFDGTIRRVSLEAVPRKWRSVGIIGRRAFVRGERNAALDLSLEDFRIGSNESRRVAIETRRAPGTYRQPVEFMGERFEVAYDIGPDHPPRMPVILWGCNSLEHAREVGFTGALSYGLYSRTPRDATARRAESHALLDQALAYGLDLSGNHAYGAFSDDALDPKCVRTDRKGGRKHVPEVSNPDLQDLARRTAAGNAADLSPHPACAALNANTEVVDHIYPSFNTEDDLYREETGRPVPDEIDWKTFSLKKAQARFPDGIVPEDDPILSYYRWWWRDGNGWPRVNSAIADEFRKVPGRRADFFSFFDPAVRCPPVWGSGGAVDVLSQWVYANPEPMAVGGPVEELFAMAKGRPGQDVMIMTQLICYRSRIAPEGVRVASEPEWVRRHPQAGFITIPPDSAVEATWTMLAKPVKGIMYHGHGTLFETGEEKGYCFTNGETTERLKALFKDVVAPLGPMLLKLPRKAPDVAVLESFTSVAMGGPHSWGWSVPAVTFLQRARLDPRVVYEDELLRDGLQDVKVLYLPQCLFLSAKSLEAVRGFQRRGGLVIADADCLAAVKPDILVPVERFPTPPKSDHREDIDGEAVGHANAKARAATEKAKADMLADAAKLREALAGRYESMADSSSGELVTYSRRWRETPYLFVVNDRRTFGDYVGPWGLTMERGLPCRGEAYLRDDGRAKAVYELSRGGRAAFSRDAAGRVRVSVDFTTNDGRLFAFLDREIASVRVEKEARDGKLHVKMSVLDANGIPVPALLPVEIRLADASGREIAGGFYAAEGGIAEADLTLDADTDLSRCRLTCRDRASGLVRKGGL